MYETSLVNGVESELWAFVGVADVAVPGSHVVDVVAADEGLYGILDGVGVGVLVTTSVTVTSWGATVGELMSTVETAVCVTNSVDGLGVTMTVSVVCSVRGGDDLVTVRVAGGSVSTVVLTTVTGGLLSGPEPGPEPGWPVGELELLPSMGTTE